MMPQNIRSIPIGQIKEAASEWRRLGAGANPTAFNRIDDLIAEVERLRKELDASGVDAKTFRPATVAHVVADMLERAGEHRPNGDILADILEQVLAALPRHKAEHRQP